jgi:hypothetical protein
MGLGGEFRDTGRGEFRDTPGCGCSTRVLGCVGLVLAVVAILFSAGSALIRPYGQQGTPGPITAASRWVSADVSLTAVQPTVDLRLTFTYSNTAEDISPIAAVSAPEFEVTPPGRTLDPAFALSEPAVRISSVAEGNGSGDQPCAAPCEQWLRLPACRQSCTSTFDIEVSLVDAAGRDKVSVSVRAGLTPYGGSPLPNGFTAAIQPLPSPTGTATPESST